MALTPTTDDFVIDVDEASFQANVVERSRELPVVVDFWAPWCGPCRTLSPTLESLAKEYAGRFVLAKINVDENQGLAVQYGIQGIPAVKAFRDGRVANEFVGAQPAPAVRQFIQKVVPGEADLKLAEARRLLDAGKLDAAEAGFQAILGKDPGQAGALLGMARVQAARGQEDAALETLGRVPLGTPEGSQAEALRQSLALRREVAGADEASLRQQVAEQPTDLEARFKLASLLTVDGRYEEALENYLEIVRRNRRYRDGAARQAMVHIFEQLGEVPLARTYRQRLASALFI